MTSSTRVLAASRCSARTRCSKSRSVMMPTTFSPSITISDPTLWRFIAMAASKALARGPIDATQESLFDRSSRTVHIDGSSPENWIDRYNHHFRAGTKSEQAPNPSSRIASVNIAIVSKSKKNFLTPARYATNFDHRDHGHWQDHARCRGCANSGERPYRIGRTQLAA